MAGALKDIRLERTPMLKQIMSIIDKIVDSPILAKAENKILDKVEQLTKEKPFCQPGEMAKEAIKDMEADGYISKPKEPIK